METNRRDFLKKIGWGIGSYGLFSLSAKKAHANLEKKIDEVKHISAAEVSKDESFWFHVQQAFNIDRSIINLNNGGVHPSPKIVMDAVHRYLDFSNGAPPYNMWQLLQPRKELIREKIAATFGCSKEEIALTRNVTEALQIALLGADLSSGDEVLTTTHDYPSMKNALYQRQKRDGINVKTFSFPYPPENMKVLADLFEKNISTRTKLILVCHITNLTGQIFPLKEICEMSRKKGIEVVIDGAHAFGHFDFKQEELNCDIYGTNLHKWMMAPIGTGFLYVKKEKIKKLWPLFPAPDPFSADIRKFEYIGTHPEALDLAVGEALAFHHGIGAKRKEERLRYLRSYWEKALSNLPNIKFLTSLDPKQSCGIGAFSIEEIDIKKLRDILFDKHKIFTITIKLPEGIEAFRITPSIYTQLSELDYFIDTVSHYVKNGLPV
ncbi:aminotransferase class V-fold PLP-dependent enzyme [Acidobacteriota bacterium]